MGRVQVYMYICIIILYYRLSDFKYDKQDMDHDIVPAYSTRMFAELYKYLLSGLRDLC